MSQQQTNVVLSAIIARVLKHEGGYVNHPSDPGGQTHYGITKRTARLHGYYGDMQDLPQSKAKSIYHDIFIGAGINQLVDTHGFALGFQFADAVVNHGPRRAAKILQATVGTVQDGVIGKKTLAAAKQFNPTEITVNYIVARMRFYTTLTTFKVFGRGWCNRVSDNLAYAAKDLKQQALNHR